jgi:predicted transcriptional regulator
MRDLEIVLNAEQLITLLAGRVVSVLNPLQDNELRNLRNQAVTIRRNINLSVDDIDWIVKEVKKIIKSHKSGG